MHTLQQLHDAEISGTIDWLFDKAWHVEIGKPKQAEATVGSMSEAIEWIEQKAQELYGWTPEDDAQDERTPVSSSRSPR
jgi:hypothetical protein